MIYQQSITLLLRYGPETVDSVGIRIHASDIGTEFVPSVVAVRHPFVLRIHPMVQICQYRATLTPPSTEILFQNVKIVPNMPHEIEESDKLILSVSSSDEAIGSIEISYTSEVETPDRIHSFTLR